MTNQDNIIRADSKPISQDQNQDVGERQKLSDDTNTNHDTNTNRDNDDTSLLRDEKFWIDDPSVLIQQDRLMSIWPRETMSRNEKLNTLSRLVIYITIIGFVFTYSLKILISGVVTLGVFVALYYFSRDNQREEFCNNRQGLGEGQGLISDFYNAPDIIDRFTMPQETNPTMNVLLTEISDNPERNMAAPAYNPIIAEQINESTREMIVKNFDNDQTVEDKLFKDLGDNFEFEQSMRNFYTTANTTIPNSQGDFAKFCYGDMISCKEGNEMACARHNPNHVNI